VKNGEDQINESRDKDGWGIKHSETGM